jgi:hypothetical protein
MLKSTLYGAVAASALAVASVITPVSAAPAAKIAPDVQANTTDAQYYYYHGRRHRHHHHHHHGWHHGHHHGHYDSFGVYVAPGFGARVYHW